MQANPVLAETVRGNWVENIHRGAYCVADAQGRVIAAGGDTGRAIFPRSAIKSIQALAMLRSGAVEKFGLTDQDIAIACASHFGEPRHVEAVAAFLGKIGCAKDDLECGVHPPMGRAAKKALREQDQPPNALHNNCSGKHAGMLAVARALDVETRDYVTRDHPVQQLVRQCAEAVIGQDLTTEKCGTDGCSIPTWAAPLSAFASGFARMATGEALEREDAAAAKRIFDAATSHPFLVGGTDSLDTELMEAFEGRLMIKIGAEGVFCGALRDSGLGFALKIDDGSKTAAEVAVSNLLLRVASPDGRQTEALERFATFTMRNWRKIEVGQTRGTAAIRQGEE